MKNLGTPKVKDNSYLYISNSPFMFSEINTNRTFANNKTQLSIRDNPRPGAINWNRTWDSCKNKESREVFFGYPNAINTGGTVDLGEDNVQKFRETAEKINDSYKSFDNDDQSFSEKSLYWVQQTKPVKSRPKISDWIKMKNNFDKDTNVKPSNTNTKVLKQPRERITISNEVNSIIIISQDEKDDDAYDEEAKEGNLQANEFKEYTANLIDKNNDPMIDIIQTHSNTLPKISSTIIPIDKKNKEITKSNLAKSAIRARSAKKPITGDTESSHSEHSFESSDSSERSPQNRFRCVSLAMLATKGPTCEDRNIPRKLRMFKGGPVDFSTQTRTNPQIAKYKVIDAQKKNKRYITWELEQGLKKECVCIIQKWWRDHKRRRLKRNQKKNKIIKIELIQSVFRGHQMRKHIKKWVTLYYYHQYFCDKIQFSMSQCIRREIFPLIIPKKPSVQDVLRRWYHKDKYLIKSYLLRWKRRQEEQRQNKLLLKAVMWKRNEALMKNNLLRKYFTIWRDKKDYAIYLNSRISEEKQKQLRSINAVSTLAEKSDEYLKQKILTKYKEKLKLHLLKELDNKRKVRLRWLWIDRKDRLVRYYFLKWRFIKTENSYDKEKKMRVFQVLKNSIHKSKKLLLTKSLGKWRNLIQEEQLGSAKAQVHEKQIRWRTAKITTLLKNEDKNVLQKYFNIWKNKVNKRNKMNLLLRLLILQYHRKSNDKWAYYFKKWKQILIRANKMITQGVKKCNHYQFRQFFNKYKEGELYYKVKYQLKRNILNNPDNRWRKYFNRWRENARKDLENEAKTTKQKWLILTKDKEEESQKSSRLLHSVLPVSKGGKKLTRATRMELSKKWFNYLKYNKSRQIEEKKEKIKNESESKMVKFCSGVLGIKSGIKRLRRNHILRKCISAKWSQNDILLHTMRQWNRKSKQLKANDKVKIIQDYLRGKLRLKHLKHLEEEEEKQKQKDREEKEEKRRKIIIRKQQLWTPLYHKLRHSDQLNLCNAFNQWKLCVLNMKQNEAATKIQTSARALRSRKMLLSLQGRNITLQKHLMKIHLHLLQHLPRTFYKWKRNSDNISCNENCKIIQTYLRKKKEKRQETEDKIDKLTSTLSPLESKWNKKFFMNRLKQADTVKKLRHKLQMFIKYNKNNSLKKYFDRWRENCVEMIKLNTKRTKTNKIILSLSKGKDLATKRKFFNALKWIGRIRTMKILFRKLQKLETERVWPNVFDIWRRKTSYNTMCKIKKIQKHVLVLLRTWRFKRNWRKQNWLRDAISRICKSNEFVVLIALKKWLRNIQTEKFIEPSTRINKLTKGYLYRKNNPRKPIEKPSTIEEDTKYAKEIQKYLRSKKPELRRESIIERNEEVFYRNTPKVVELKVNKGDIVNVEGKDRSKGIVVDKHNKNRVQLLSHPKDKTESSTDYERIENIISTNKPLTIARIVKDTTETATQKEVENNEIKQSENITFAAKDHKALALERQIRNKVKQNNKLEIEGQVKKVVPNEIKNQERFKINKTEKPVQTTGTQIEITLEMIISKQTSWNIIPERQAPFVVSKPSSITYQRPEKEKPIFSWREEVIDIRPQKQENEERIKTLLHSFVSKWIRVEPILKRVYIYRWRKIIKQAEINESGFIISEFWTNKLKSFTAVRNWFRLSRLGMKDVVRRMIIYKKLTNLIDKTYQVKLNNDKYAFKKIHDYSRIKKIVEVIQSNKQKQHKLKVLKRWRDNSNDWNKINDLGNSLWKAEKNWKEQNKQNAVNRIYRVFAFIKWNKLFSSLAHDLLAINGPAVFEKLKQNNQAHLLRSLKKMDYHYKRSEHKEIENQHLIQLSFNSKSPKNLNRKSNVIYWVPYLVRYLNNLRHERFNYVIDKLGNIADKNKQELLKDKLVRIAKKRKVSEWLIVSKETSKYLNLIYLIRITRLFKVFARNKFIHRTINLWRALARRNKDIKEGMRDLYKNLQKTYVQMSKDLFGNNDPLNPSIQDNMQELLDKQKDSINAEYEMENKTKEIMTKKK